MTFTVRTDHAAIRAVLDRLLAQDPVGNTVLGTIAITLGDSAWLAVDGDPTTATCVAVRSGVDRPVVMTHVPAGVRDELRSLLLDLPDVVAVAGARDDVFALLDTVGPDPRLEHQRLYRLDGLEPPGDVVGRAVIATPGHRELGRAWFAAFVREVGELERGTDEQADAALDAGAMFLWLDGDDHPAALACRRPVLAGSARVGPVYTPPEHRGHGYGSGVTAAATHAILDEGGVPVLFTDLDNPTSNRIYQRLGYRPVSDRLVAHRRR